MCILNFLVSVFDYTYYGSDKLSSLYLELHVILSYFGLFS